jgi:hypothetical protein
VNDAFPVFALVAAIVDEFSGEQLVSVACSLAAVPPSRPETAAVSIMVFIDLFIELILSGLAPPVHAAKLCYIVRRGTKEVTLSESFISVGHSRSYGTVFRSAAPPDGIEATSKRSAP